jgi:hypothetical protein
MVTPNREAFKRHFSIDPISLCQTPQQNEAFLTGMANSYLNHLHADWLLMIGGFPEDDRKVLPPVYLAIGNAEGVKTKAIPQGFSPSLLKMYIAKQALNLARLTMMGK